MNNDFNNQVHNEYLALMTVFIERLINVSWKTTCKRDIDLKYYGLFKTHSTFDMLPSKGEWYLNPQDKQLGQISQGSVRYDTWFISRVFCCFIVNEVKKLISLVFLNIH